ncbi:hypothetical protein EV401DRAFT_2206497 [Pisolithus croceorrhizus]|nr:hypothetical protein EV401DRAFT_2206497 [Pisolithus croceorrhizus]
MSATEEEELQVLYDNLRQIRLLNNVVLSCAAFVAYDILTNLDREVCYIPLIWRYYHDVDNDEYTSWHRRARHILVQILFVFGRYYALLYLVLLFIVNSHQGLSVSVCKAYLYYFIFGGELPYTTLVNIILVIRLNAMYRIIHGTQGLRKYQVFLSCVAIAEFVAEFIVAAVMVTWMVQRVVEPPAGVPWPGCSLSESPNTALTLPAWVTAILVATIFLGLTLRLLYSSMKLKFGHFGDFTVSNIKEKIRNIQPITLTLVRDSVLIYFPMLGRPTNTKSEELTTHRLNLGILVASVPIMVVYESAVIATVTLPIIPAVYSFSASRLIIHTREGFSPSSHFAKSQEIGSIKFTSRPLAASRVEMHKCAA